MTGDTAYALWIETGLALSMGTIAIVAFAVGIAATARRAVWQRAIWQTALVGVWALLAAELSGMGEAIVGMAWPDTGRKAENAAPSQTGVALAVANEGQSPRAACATEYPATEHPPAHDAAHDAADWLALTAVDLMEGRGSAHPPAESAPVAEVDFAVELLAAAPGEENLAPEVDFGRAPAAASAPMSTEAFGDARVVSDPGGVWWPAYLWLLGAAPVAGRAGWARWLLGRFRRRHPPVGDESLAQKTARIAGRLGIRRPVAVLEANGLKAPVAFGTFRPTLVVPAGFSRQFDGRAQEAILLHELAHLASGDPAWQFAADMTCAAMWWHPMAWWLRCRLRAAGEAAADEASQLIPGAPETLASCLVALGRRLAPPRAGMAWNSIEGPAFRSSLGRRVERLLDLPSGPSSVPSGARLAGVRAMLTVFLVVVAVLCTAWARPQADLDKGGTTMSAIWTSWRHSLAAAALTALWAPLSDGAIAAEGTPEPPKPAVVGELVDRGEAAPREGERPDRDRPERRERDEATPRDRERGESPERNELRMQIEVLRTALHAFREAEQPEAVELIERAIHAREVTLEGRRDDEARAIRERTPDRGRLVELLKHAAGIWRDLGKPDSAKAVAQLAERMDRPREGDRPRGPDVERRDPGPRERGDDARARREQLARDMAAKRGALEERASQLRRMLEHLRELKGVEPEALQAKIEEAQRQLADAARALAERWEGGREAQERVGLMIQQRMGQIRELYAEYAKALREGQPERAEDLHRKIAEAIEFLQRAPWRVPDRPDKREEIERRMRHVEAAIENLHAAGLHDLAERIAAEAPRVERGERSPAPRRPTTREETPRVERGDPFELRDPRAPVPEPVERLKEEVRGLHQQVGDLRNEMREVRSSLERLIQRLEKQ